MLDIIGMVLYVPMKRLYALLILIGMASDVFFIIWYVLMALLGMEAIA